MENYSTFDSLTLSIRQVHETTSNYAKGAVNQLLTVRNWMIGYYIVEYEQGGKDRAEYGIHLLQDLATKLSIKGLDRSMLNMCRLFYIKYPQIRDSVSRRLQLVRNNNRLQTAIGPREIWPDESCRICDSANHKFETDAELLISRLSFTHLREIIKIEDPLERFFYEMECIKGTWSVRELRRQIDTKLFYRAGISQNPELAIEEIPSADISAVLSVKNPYALDFLGLDAKDAVDESDLEQAIMDHLQEFLLEMGNGFCFESRQKRILIDDEYYFIDLVLYNRILHCSVIVELKVDKFRIEHAAQLNAYVSYFKDCEMTQGDNPPVGILLCTEKGPKMVQYVLNGMDENLFVSTYMLKLPAKEKLEAFLMKEVYAFGRYS